MLTAGPAGLRVLNEPDPLSVRDNAGVLGAGESPLGAAIGTPAIELDADGEVGHLLGSLAARACRVGPYWYLARIVTCCHEL